MQTPELLKSSKLLSGYDMRESFVNKFTTSHLLWTFCR